MTHAIAHALREARVCPYIPAMPFVVELLHADAQPPRRATEGSAGYDLCAYVRGRTIKCSDAQRTWEVAPESDSDTTFALPPGVAALIPLGFKARLPHGIEAQIRPRSGTSFKKGLAIPNAPGTVDSDYPEEWLVLVRNPTPWPIPIAHGERIAQAVLARYEVLPVEDGKVSVTTSRVGGFGSTGPS
ncbi:MAG TPA: dUTP diphosphatase [Gemmatimonadaceae bacterium]|nr:dUTP diphosphatase [Gemmatimonadaceae bacterium]